MKSQNTCGYFKNGSQSHGFGVSPCGCVKHRFFQNGCHSAPCTMSSTTSMNPVKVKQCLSLHVSYANINLSWLILENTPQRIQKRVSSLYKSGVQKKTKSQGLILSPFDSFGKLEETHRPVIAMTTTWSQASGPYFQRVDI